MRRFLICAILVLSGYPQLLHAQWRCHTTAGMNFMEGTEFYGTYWYTSVTSSGDFVVAAANVTTLTHHEPYGFYLAFLLSYDGGKTWSVTSEGLPAPTWAHRPIVRKLEIIDPTHIFAFGDSSLLVRSTNGGASWQVIPAPTKHNIGDISFSDSLHGVMVVWDTSQGTYTTSDGGVNWTAVPFTRLAVGQCHDYGDGRYRFFSVFDGRVYTVQNWIVVDSTAPIISDSTAKYFVYARCSFGRGDTLFAYGNRNYYAVRQGLRPFIARSIDGGKHWDHVYDADTTNFWDLGSAEYMSDVKRDTIVAGLRGGANQVLWSLNHGATWQFDTLLEQDDANNLAADSYGVALNAEGDIICADTWDGADGAFLLWGTRKLESVPRPHIQSDELTVYPSPAVSSVTVGGDLAATIRVIDMLGREVLSAQPTSEAETQLDVSNLPPAVYFVTDGRSMVKFVKR